MVEDKNSEKKKKPEEEGEEEDVQKDLNEIMEKLSEKPGEGKPKEKPKEEKVPEPVEPTSKPAEEEPEDLEGILEKISEKEPSETETPAEELGIGARIVGVFFNPEKIFTYLRSKPDIWIPLIIIILFGIIASATLYDIAIDTQIQKIEQNPNIPDERKDLIIDSMESRREGTWRYISIFVFPSVGAVVMVSLVALVFLFIGNVLLGGQSKFKQIFSVYAYAYLIPTILGSIVKIPLILQKKSIDVHTSLAIFLPDDASKTTLYRFLDSLDVFTLWFLIVFGIGFSILYRMTKGKGIATVFTTWLIWVLITKIALGSFFGAFGS